MDWFYGLMQDYQHHHSDFQIDNFILVMHGMTPYGQYKQCLRELHGRWRTLKRNWIEKQRLMRQLNAKDDLDVAEARMALEDWDTQNASTFREFVRFAGHAMALKEQLGDLTPERKAELERDFWLHKAKAMLAMDLLTCNAVTAGTAEMIQSLPAEMKREVFSLLTGGHVIQQQLTTWWMNYDCPLPEAKLIQSGTVQLAIEGGM